MNASHTILASVLLVVGSSMSWQQALAQAFPPPAAPALESGARLVTSRLVQGQLQMRDSGSGKFLIGLHNNMRLLSGFDHFTTTVTLQEQPAGCDLIIDVFNNTDNQLMPGTIGIGTINLGEHVQYFNNTQYGIWVPAQASTMVTNGFTYPDDMYSPTLVARSDDMVVGVSIQYPVLEYKHDVRMLFGNGWGEFGNNQLERGWAVRYELGGGTHGGMPFRGNLMQPGERRRYVVSVRVSRNTDDWIQTLVPYRNYFRDTYGPVQYQRKTTPVLGETLVNEAQMSTSNPYGYREDLRPDVNGWNRTRQHLLRKQGWPSVMVWAPTGIYRNHPDYNFPYQIGSQWNRSPQMATALDPEIGLPGVVAAGRELGLWWGFSVQQSTQWDNGEHIDFDPDNAEQRARAFAELDGIAATGATMVGLDSYAYKMPFWKAYQWIKDMQERHPQISFITEPAQCDILHTIAPTFLTAYPVYPTADMDTPEEFYLVKGPNLMHDFINPGHETWACMSYHVGRNRTGWYPSVQRMEDDMRQFASWGYRPVYFELNTMPANVSTAPSWEESLPVAVTINDPLIRALRRGERTTDLARAFAERRASRSGEGQPAPSGDQGQGNANAGGSGGENPGDGTSGSGLVGDAGDGAPQSQARLAPSRGPGVAGLSAPRSPRTPVASAQNRAASRFVVRPSNRSRANTSVQGQAQPSGSAATATASSRGQSPRVQPMQPQRRQTAVRTPAPGFRMSPLAPKPEPKAGPQQAQAKDE